MVLRVRQWIAEAAMIGFLAAPLWAQRAARELVPETPNVAPAVAPATRSAAEINLPAPTRPRTLPEMMPEGTLLYIGWPGMDALAETCGETALAKMLAEPELVRFREKLSKDVIPALERLIGQEMDETEQAEFEAIKRLLTIVWHRPVAIGVVEVGFGETGPRVDAAVVVRAGREAGQAAETFEKLLEGSGILEEAVEERLGVATFKAVPLMGPQLSLRWGVYGDNLLVTVGDRVLQHLAAGEQSKNLAQSERFAAAMKAVGSTPALPTLFLDIKAAMGLVEALQPLLAGFGVPVVGEQGGVQKVMDTIGLGPAQSLTVVMAPESDGFKTTTLLHMPGSQTSAEGSPGRKPLTDADLAVVPKDASWATVSNFDLRGFYQAVLDGLQALAPGIHNEVMAVLADAEKSIGFSIGDDLLGSFGDTWAIFDAPSHGGVWITGMVIVGELKPDSRLDQVVEKLAELVAQKASGQADVEIATEQYRGRTIHFVNVSGLPIPVAPAWSEHDGKLVMGLYPQMVRGVLDRLMDKSESILANADFVRGRKLMPDGFHTINYIDTAAGVRSLYPFGLLIGQVLAAMGQGEGVPVNVSALPSLPTVSRHLFGHVSATAMTKDGVLCVSHGALPFAVPVVGQGAMTVPLMASIMLPSLARARGQARRTVSAANLKGIGTAMFVYANEHDDKYPPDLQTLVDDGSISPQALISPLDKSGAKVSYIYIAGQNTDVDQRNVLAYENPDNYHGEGTMVLFADSHVEFLSMPEFEKALAKTNERLGRESGQPAEIK